MPYTSNSGVRSTSPTAIRHDLPPTQIDSPQAQRHFFLHKSISLSWVERLSSCGTLCFQVGMVICYWTVLERSAGVKATAKKFARFGISKDQKTRALKKLRAHRLIDYENSVGRNPTVTIIL